MNFNGGDAESQSHNSEASSGRDAVRWVMTNRKWVWVGTIGVGVIAAMVVAVLAAWRFTTHQDQSSASDCQVVRAIIDYNKSQGRILANAFNPGEDNEPSVSDYQNWASQLQEYAARISASDLATHAHLLADEANKVVELIKQVRSDISVPADLDAPPPWAQQYADLGKQFQSDLVALNRFCPR